jgi:hypothetical protein
MLRDEVLEVHAQCAVPKANSGQQTKRLSTDLVHERLPGDLLCCAGNIQGVLAFLQVEQ